MAEPSTNSTSPLQPGRHYDFIKSKLPQWLIEAKPEQRAELKKTRARMPDWYASSTPAQKKLISQLQRARFASQGVLSDAVIRIQSVEAFAQPLLEAALKAKGFELSVNEVYLHLYVPATDAFGVLTSGFDTKFLSLLQGALHNFEAAETEPGYYAPESSFITKPAADGTYKPYITSLKLEEFTQLCRDLDIGAKYQAYLNSASGVPEHPLRDQYLIHQKDALKLDAEIALLRGHIDEPTHALMMRVVAGEQDIWSGHLKLWYRRLAVMKLDLNGCVVFDLSTHSGLAQSVVIWIPGDPEHPLKRYESFYDFRDEMIGKLTSRAFHERDVQLTSYQQFISGFIAQKDRPLFYLQLTELRLDAPELPWWMAWFSSSKTQFWVRALAPLQTSLIAVPSTPDAHVSRVPKEHPFLDVDMFVMRGFGLWDDVDLWDRMFIEMREGIFSNARFSAVSTADADANTLSIRLSHYLNIGMFGINLLAMAVPVLGEVMMVVMAAQMLYETLEGCIEWAQGDTEAAWRHISDVLENIAMLAGGAVVFHVAVAPVIEKLKVVTLPGGIQKLWNPDLAPYERSVTLAPHSEPDENGLHLVNNQDILPHEGKHYVLEDDLVSGDFRAQHPSRADAYQPTFRHNGHGVWVNEVESPLTWERSTLLRRLGPSVEGLSDTELEQILHISDIREDELRRMYVENEPTPAVLQDYIEQFHAYSKTMRAVNEAKAGRFAIDSDGLTAAFMVELGGWPRTKAIAIVDSSRPLKVLARYGNPRAVMNDVISIRAADLLDGKLPEKVVDALNSQELSAMLGDVTRDGRVRLLKEKLAKHMENNTSRLFNSLYDQPLADDDPLRPAVDLIKRVFPKLTTASASLLVSEASMAELAQLKLGKIPSRVMNKARVLQRDVRFSSAYRGLYLEGLVTADCETLALNTLEKLPGWRADLRIEVRNETFSGELRASVGPENGVSSRKVLVRLSEGKYQAFDGAGETLHSPDTFYNSLQRTLPDAQRVAIGLPGSWQGNDLKVSLQQHALGRDDLGSLLKMRRESRPFFLPPERLPDGRLGYPLSGRGATGAAQDQTPALRRRLRILRPEMSADDMTRFFEINAGDKAHRRVRGLEIEFKELNDALSEWKLSSVRGQELDADTLTRSQLRTLKLRNFVKTRLIEAWQLKGPTDVARNGAIRGRHLNFKEDIAELNPMPAELGPILESLPTLPADFSHISHLDLNNCGLTNDIDGFLQQFKKLRLLDLTNNQLSALPPSIARMSRLEGLGLRQNRIVLTAQSVADLKGLTKIRLLYLSGSPLGLPPDISRMPDLEILKLTNCGLESWPTGLLDQPRSRLFQLHMESNRLLHIPDVELGSPEARTIARTMTTRSMMSDEVLQQYKAYSESVGIESERNFPPAEEMHSDDWIDVLHADDVALKQAIWNQVENAKGSEPFFNVLSDQAANFSNRSHAFKIDIKTKVWRMLEAMSESSELRDKIFSMARAPTTCVDAGAQLFNSLGVEVMWYEVYRAPQQWLVEVEALSLAKGKARLDELGAIARARVKELERLGRRHPEYDFEGRGVRYYDAQGVLLRPIDEVEIYLKYTTQLANRLELPWQSPEMQFIEPDVTVQMLNDAEARVRALEQGDGMRNQLLEQPKWLEFVEGRYRSRFDELHAKAEALENYREAQQDYVDDKALTADEKEALRLNIIEAGRALGKTPDTVVPGHVMTDAEYDAAYQQLGKEKQHLLESLTDELMGR